MIIPPFSIASVLAGTADDGQEFDVDGAVAALEPDDPTLGGNLTFHVRFVRQGKELEVEINDLSTTVTSECSRCATPCSLPIATKRIRAFVPIDGFDEDYPIRIDAKKGQVDLSEWLRVEILAVIDLFPLCRADCLGCCPTCGKDLNTQTCACARSEGGNPFAELAKHFTK